jgi:hypothetical protein
MRRVQVGKLTGGVSKWRDDSWRYEKCGQEEQRQVKF